MRGILADTALLFNLVITTIERAERKGKCNPAEFENILALKDKKHETKYDWKSWYWITGTMKVIQIKATVNEGMKIEM